ncbi:TetR/AcrR family transcriptional regulator [Falsirhodobacter xinxiangensis]|uniref:TetR/AcrR family transcriptional regulator n=1 Tax=Falsirhodobacter xinxiangensis TaxID=2530049 RepID=UPI0010AAE3AD|nr:TetR/AcrR family transcriptional regulator [Rhodobacter xinxiangensis]
MGRKRTIDRNVTMEAIESVVRQSGIAGLSIDAVAKEAGISKSSVVYDFQNKNQLLAAFIKSRIDEKRANIARAAEAREGEPNAWLRALLDCSCTPPSEEDMATAMVISAGTGTNDVCRTLMREAFNEDVCRILSQSDDPRSARLSWLALNGLLSMEYFGFHTFSEAERQQILTDIAWLMSGEPDTSLSNPQVQK